MVTERFEAQLRAIIRDEVQQAVNTFNKDDCVRCALCSEPEFASKHAQHHQAVEEFLVFVRHLNEAKWSAFKTVLASIVLGLVLAFLYFFFDIKQP